MDNSQWAQEGGIVKSMGERKLVRPEKDEALNCPRCHSTNTKFCYYNNYSLTQPRYLCKTCRRYWTQGGSLRNVPVGGGSRKKNKRSSSSLPVLNPATQFPVPQHLNPNTSAPLSALDLLRSGRGLNPCIQTPGFPFQEFKPAATLGFPVDGNGTRFGGSDLHQENGGGMLLFPFGSLSKQSEDGENNKGQGNSSTGYWNGMFGGGSW